MTKSSLEYIHNSRSFVASLVMDLNEELRNIALISGASGVSDTSIKSNGKVRSNDVLRVSSASNPNAIAGAIANILKNQKTTELHVIGAAALNQAIKAIAIARGYMAPIGEDLVCVPAFAEIEVDGRQKTAIRLIVQTR